VFKVAKKKQRSKEVATFFVQFTIFFHFQKKLARPITHSAIFSGSLLSVRDRRSEMN
jgi:hypothetical protein